jgi:hypothetical protein
MENDGLDCLVARVSAFGDIWNNDQWGARKDRHVAQKDITVVDIHR